MSESAKPEWLSAGQGRMPRPRWSFSTEARLVSIELARETGAVLAADETGGLYLLNRSGQLATLTRGFQHVAGIALCDTGEAAAAIVRESGFCRLDRHLKTEWSIELTEPILAIAMDPFGEHIAVSMANGDNRVYNSRKKLIGRFQTFRPLGFLHFLATETTILGAAEYGLLCSHSLDGEEIWREALWTNVGDLSASGDGSTLFLPVFNRGIQRFDHEGSNRGSYVLDGAANHSACGYVPARFAVSTVERHLYWLGSGGEMLWATLLPDDVSRLQCDPLCNWIVCGFNSGRIIRMDWPPDA